MITKLPRNGEYELFILDNKIYCHDDPTFTPVTIKCNELDEWINKQPESLWRTFLAGTAYYLKPELYIWFKLRWSC